MSVTFKIIAGSAKSSHQEVATAGEKIGEIWREQVNVVVSKLTEPRCMALKWRWFAKRDGDAGTLGRGTRTATLLGPGFKNKDAATVVLTEAFASTQIVDVREKLLAVVPA
jgi:hypothetical protein